MSGLFNALIGIAIIEEVGKIAKKKKKGDFIF